MSRGRFTAAIVGLFCLLALPSPASAMKFTAPDNALTGLDYIAREISADFDGDGRADLATATNNSLVAGRGIRIRLAQNGGSWTSAPLVDSGEASYSIASGDFNHDDKVDLVSYRNQGHGTRVFFGNGNGTFGSEAAVDAPWNSSNSLGSSHALTTGDLNNDGNDDIVFPLGHGEFALSLSDGSGGFSTANSSGVTGAPSGPTDRFVTAAIGDYNGDNKKDIALGMAPSTLNDPSLVDVFVMLGDGTGSFSPAAGNPVPVTETAGYVGAVYSLAAARFNSDGRDDLAISTASDGQGLASAGGAGTIQVMLGSSANGLSPASVVAYSDQRPSPVLAGDFDRDGITDLAWMERFANGLPADYLVIQRGNGDGTFSAEPNSPFLFADGTGSTSDMVSGDFNGDGATDFAASYFQDAIRFLKSVPDLSTSPDTIDFGNVVKSNTQASRLVQIRNAGGPNLQIGTVTLTGDDAADFTLPADCPLWTLNAANSCNQHVKFTPNLDPGSYNANVHVTFNGSTETLNIPVTATIIVPQASFDPSALAFGQLRPGQSKTLTLVATNTGDASLTFMPNAPINDNAGGYFTKVSDSCSGSSIGPGSTCSVQIKATGDNASIDETKTAELHLASDGYQSQTDVNLSFSGVNPGIDVDPSNGQFGSVPIGNSTERTFTIDSTGTTDLNISDVEISGNQDTDFRLGENSTNCEGIYEPTDGCEITIEFRPQSTSPALRTGQITIQTNSQDSAIVIPLVGTATRGDAAFSPNEIDFGDVTVGQSSTRTVTVTSNGTSSLKADSVWVDGPNGPDDFSLVSETCSARDVAVGETCTIELRFSPTSRLSHEAYAGLEVPGISDEIHMVGKGVQPSAKFDATSYNLGEAEIGTGSDRPSQTVTVTSTGQDPVTIKSLAIAGPDAEAFRIGDTGVCSTPLPVNEKCQILVTFDPQSGNAGGRSATLAAVTTGGTVEAAISGTATATAPDPVFTAKIQVKYPKKVKAKKKKFALKLSVSVTNTGTGDLSGASLTYKAKQGKAGSAIMTRRLALPSVPAGKSIRKNITINLRSHLAKRGKSLKSSVVVTYGGQALASSRGTTRLDFGQAKIRRPRDVSNT